MKPLFLFLSFLVISFISCEKDSNREDIDSSTDIEALPADFYVSSSGSDSNSGAQDMPFASIAHALKASKPGNIIEVMNEITEVIDAVDFQKEGGTNSDWKIIRGAKFGTIVNGYIKGTDSDSSLGAAYVEVHNIHWRQGTHTSGWSKFTHVKAFNCGFEGGGLGYNEVSHSAGSYQLYEGCYFYGVGGRSRSLLYQRENTIYRRCIFRHDEGWGHDGQPSNVLSIYSSTNVAIQQCISVDNITPEITYEHGNFNCTSNRGGVSVRWMNCFTIDSEELGYNISGSQDQIEVSYENCVALRCGNGIVVNTASGVTGSVTINEGEYSDLTKQAFSHYGNGSETVTVSNTNSYNCPTIFGSNINDLGSNTENQTAITFTSYKRIGVSGTLYNESGWDKTLDKNLFPLPYEKEIRGFMIQIEDRGNRGFCGPIYASSSQPLTDYIFR